MDMHELAAPGVIITKFFSNQQELQPPDISN